MWHKPCRTFHPWCPCIKTRCLWLKWAHLLSYPGYFREPHWKSMGLPEISRVTWQVWVGDSGFPSGHLQPPRRRNPTMQEGLINIKSILVYEMAWCSRSTKLSNPTLPEFYNAIWHHITLTSWWPRWRLKSPASRLFTQAFIQTQIKENIKAPCHWPLCGEFTGTSEFPAQRASYAENVSIWWRHHENKFTRI